MITEQVKYAQRYHSATKAVQLSSRRINLFRSLNSHFQFFGPFHLRYIHPIIFLTPAIMGHITETKLLDGLDNHLALADEDIGFSKFGNNVFKAIAFLGA